MFSHGIKSIILEPVTLVGEGRFNLNAIKHIKVTDSYLKMDKEVKQCQIDEDIEICTTRQHREAFLKHCGCVPFSIGNFEYVS